MKILYVNCSKKFVSKLVLFECKNSWDSMFVSFKGLLQISQNVLDLFDFIFVFDSSEDEMEQYREWYRRVITMQENTNNTNSSNKTVISDTTKKFEDAVHILAEMMVKIHELELQVAGLNEEMKALREERRLDKNASKAI